MRIERIPGANLDLVGSTEIEESHPETEILGLPVIATGKGYVSQWRPSQEEIMRLILGAPVYLSVLGERHPPVMIDVGQIPSRENATAAPSN